MPQPVLSPIRSSLRWKARLLVVLVLVIALGLWLWVLQRTLANERDAMNSRLSTDLEGRFANAIKTVRGRIEDDRQLAFQLFSHAEEGSYLPLLEQTSIDSALLPKPSYLQKEGSFSETHYVPGSDLTGRDPHLRQALDHLFEPEIREAVKARLLDFNDLPLRPSFRAWAIGRYLEIVPDDPNSALLERLAVFESYCASPPRETATVLISPDPSPLLWSVSTVQRFFNEAGVAIQVDDEGKSFLSWAPQFRIAPLQQAWDESSFEKSSSLIRWVGIACALLFLAAVVGSFWFARREAGLARMRMDLAAAMAHELRTPLAGQRLVLESLASDLQQTPKKRGEYLDMAASANKRLGRLADQFLTFSRLERDALKLEPAELNLNQVVGEAMESWTERFDEVSLNVPKNLVARLDQDAVATILTNLVENAWKYSQAPRQLSLSISKTRSGICLEVADRGLGLSENEHKRAFQKYWRAEQGLSRSSDGMGLGLAIVQSLAQAHGGSVASRPRDGGGTIFTVELQEL